MLSNVLITGRSSLASYWHIGRRAGLRLPLQKESEELICAASALLRGAIGRPPRVRSIRRLARTYRIPAIGCRDIHRQDVLDRMRSWEPDVLVSVYVCQVLKRPILELSRHGAINFHPALLPRNRGLMPYVWALANGDRRAGGTVHRVDERLDTGDVILQRGFAIRDDETVFSLAFRSAALGGELLGEAIRRIESGRADAAAQDHESASSYSWPDRACMKRLRGRGRRLGRWSEMWRCFLRGDYLEAPQLEEET